MEHSWLPVVGRQRRTTGVAIVKDRNKAIAREPERSDARLERKAAQARRCSGLAFRPSANLHTVAQ